VTDPTEGMLAKIRAMLAKAESTEFEAEAESYRVLAYRLAEKYSIDRAMLQASRPEQERDKPGRRKFQFEGSYTMEQLDLLAYIAFSYGGRAVQDTYRGRAYEATIYAFESDLDMIELLYTSLRLQQVGELRKAKIPDYLWRGEIARWKRSWMKGFSKRVYDRLVQQRARAASEYDRDHGMAADGTGAELVLVNRKAQVDLYFTDSTGAMGTAKRRNIGLDYDGLNQGEKAGGRADIGTTRVGGAPQAQLPRGS
jgi:hypothetical protein